MMAGMPSAIALRPAGHDHHHRRRHGAPGSTTASTDMPLMVIIGMSVMVAAMIAMFDQHQQQQGQALMPA